MCVLSNGLMAVGYWFVKADERFFFVLSDRVNSSLPMDDTRLEPSGLVSVVTKIVVKGQ